MDPDWACTQAFLRTFPGGPGGRLADHTLQFVVCLVSHGAQIVPILPARRVGLPGLRGATGDGFGICPWRRYGREIADHAG